MNLILIQYKHTGRIRSSPFSLKLTTQMITRRNFILLGSLGLLSTITPNFLYSKSLDVLNDETETLLKLARKYRREGRFQLAKKTYEKIISIDQKEIRAYNGLRRILLNGKNKEYEVIQLYQRALTNMPKNVRIKRQLYNEYLNAGLGNRKVLTQINIPGRMLTYVKERYEEILDEYPEKKNLQNQLAKIDKYIALNIDLEHPHKNKALKDYRKSLKEKYKRRFDHLRSEELARKLETLEKKGFEGERKRHIRELSKLYIKSLRKEKKYETALNLSYEYLTKKDHADPYFMKHFRELSKYTKKYDLLLLYENENHKEKNSFWSAVSLLDAYILNAIKNNARVTSRANELISFLLENANSPNEILESKFRRIKLDIANLSLQEAERKLLVQSDEMIGIKNTHNIDRINTITAEFFSKAGKKELKNIIVDLAMNPKSFVEHPDNIIKNLAHVNSGRSYEKAIHIQNLQQKISKL